MKAPSSSFVRLPKGHDPQRRADGLHPLPETRLERLGPEAVEDALEGVMRRDAVGQRQEAPQPACALTAECLDLLPVLGAGDDGAQSDDEDILQAVEPPVAPPRVFQLAEVPGDRQVWATRGLCAVNRRD